MQSSSSEVTSCCCRGVAASPFESVTVNARCSLKLLLHSAEMKVGEALRLVNDDT